MPTDRTQTMVRLYMEQGLTYAEIGERYGVTRQRVHQLIGELVDPDRPSRRPSATLHDLRAAHERVMSNQTTLAEEAERLRYASEASLRGAMAKNGLLFAGRVRPQAPLPKHGTRPRYDRGCHCAKCRAANTEYNRTLRMTGDPPNHGTESGYRNYGCRCVPCTEAAIRADRERRARARRKIKVAA